MEYSEICQFEIVTCADMRVYTYQYHSKCDVRSIAMLRDVGQCYRTNQIRHSRYSTNHAALKSPEIYNNWLPNTCEKMSLQLSRIFIIISPNIIRSTVLRSGSSMCAIVVCLSRPALCGVATASVYVCYRLLAGVVTHSSNEQLIRHTSAVGTTTTGIADTESTRVARASSHQISD